MTDPRFLDPIWYKVGAQDIGQFEWLDERLTLHGHPLIKYDDTFRRRVQNFQLDQGWTGTTPPGNADGYVGKVTLRLLAADPIAATPIDLSIWKWTGPTPLGGDRPDEVFPIGAFQKVPYFVRWSDGPLSLRAPVDGATTPTSDYPRSEFREMSKSGAKADWGTASGKNEMVIEQAINHLPEGKPHVVAGQIHDATDDVVMIRLEGPRLFVESDGDEIAVLDENYRLGTRFRITIRTDHAGIYVYYNGTIVEAATLRGQWEHCYFKAGVYTQAYEGQNYNGKVVPEGAYGEVIIYSLTVSHT